MKRIVLKKVRDCKSCCRYEASNALTARGKDRPIIATLYLNKTFADDMPEIVEVTVTPGVQAPNK